MPHTLAYQTESGRQKVYRDTQYSRDKGQSPWENVSPLILNDPGTAIVVGDDFAFDTTADYTAVKGTGDTLTVTGALGGAVSIPTAASAANDYQLISTPNAIFKPTLGCPIIFEAKINCTEANTNKASWMVGLTSTTTTGFLANTGLPPSSYSGAVFYKAQSGMLLKAQTSKSTTQATSSTLATLVSAQTYLLGMYIDPYDGVTASVRYYVSTITGGARTFVTSGTLALPLASIAAMKFAMAIRCASTSAETLTVDYWRLAQIRPLV